MLISPSFPQSVVAYQTAEKQIDQYATTARADLTPLVTKARADLEKLSETTKAELQRLSEASANVSSGTGGSSVMIGADGTPVIIDDPVPKVDKGKGVDRSVDDGATPSEGGAYDSDKTPAAAASAFFASLQSQISASPNLAHLSKNLQSSLTTVQSNLSHLPASLQTSVAQLQAQLPHLDNKAAEAYLSRGEHWLQEFTGEVGRLAKDAVRVVPPTEAEKTKKREERARKAERGAAGRTEAALIKLRADEQLLLVDPAKPPAVVAAAAVEESQEGAAVAATTAGGDTREAFSKFLQTVEDKGGFEGEEWTKRIAAETDETLKQTRAALVPSKLTPEAFWSRYFFRRELIDEEERRRQEVLLKGASFPLSFECHRWRNQRM